MIESAFLGGLELLLPSGANFAHDGQSVPRRNDVRVGRQMRMPIGAPFCSL